MTVPRGPLFSTPSGYPFEAQKIERAAREHAV